MGNFGRKEKGRIDFCAIFQPAENEEDLRLFFYGYYYF